MGDPQEVPFIDIGEDGDPVPENGVARPAETRDDEKKRRRNSPTRAEGRRDPIPATDPPRDFADSDLRGKPVTEKTEWPVDAGPLWLKILSWLPTQTIDDQPAMPDDVLIAVERVSGGGATGGASFPDPIEGASVCGSDDESAASALMRVVTDTYHVPVCTRTSRATYKLRFYWRRGAKGAIKTSAPFTLDSPENIGRTRVAKGLNSSEMHPLGHDAPAPSSSGKDYDLGYMRAKIEEYERALREGRAPRPVGPTVQQPSQATDWHERIELERQLAEAKAKADAEKTAREAAEKYAAEKAEMQRQLDALKAQQEKDALNRRLADLEQRIANPPQPQATMAQEIVQILQTLGLIQVGPDGKPMPVGAGASYTSPQVTPEQQIAAAAKVLADAELAKQKAREEVRKTWGFAEPSTEIVEQEQEAEPGILQKAAKLVGDNLGVIAAGGSAVISGMVDQLAPGSPLAAIVKGAVSEAQAAALRASTKTGGGSAGYRPPSA